MLEIRRLVKHFGPLVAVDDVSFAVARGDVLGFLGPNGAGKSTTMKMITGFVAPDAGTAVVCGHDVARAPLAAKRCIGYLPEGAPAYPDMTPAEFLGFIAHIRGFSGREAKRRIGRIVETIHIAEVMHQPIETLSKGYRRRVGVAQALLHDPQVLILDEPTDGLDPNQKYEMRKVIDEMRANKAIVISTHLLEEVEAVCSRAIIIAHGKILADATPVELARRSRRHNAVRLVATGAAPEQMRAELSRLPGVGAVETVADGDGKGLLVFPRVGEDIVADVADLARAHRWQVSLLRVEHGRLDDVFREITTATSETLALAAAA
ncbi:MAG TPA: ATP-binding cassette domain-containing protein [Stellaceae bacterium]|nr:ATP-binding cassette domain-containing protein [Stellaceae bacterium]